MFPQSVSAAQTAPYKVNFQGRLANASSVVLSGTYDMQFKLYTASSGGTFIWGETRTAANGNAVTVTNGLFNILIGEGTVVAGSSATLQAAVAANQTMYLEVTIGVETLSPRSQFGSSPYAINADMIDGIDGANLGQLSASNVWTGANTVRLNSSSALSVQNASSVDLLVADTSATVVKIGNPGSSTLSNVRLFTSLAEVSTTLRVGDATNGVEISTTGLIYRGTGRPTRTITLSPEYPGATFTPDGSSNTGTLTSDFCSNSALLNINPTACNNTGNEHNYYAWTTTQASVQDYDVYVRYRIPTDYDTGSMTNMKIWGWGTTSANEVVSLSLYKGSGTACGTITNAITGNTTWNEATLASPLGACSIAADEVVTLRVHVVAGKNNTARAGEISFTYRKAN